jgi:hypothetical protein
MIMENRWPLLLREGLQEVATLIPDMRNDDDDDSNGI